MVSMDETIKLEFLSEAEEFTVEIDKLLRALEKQIDNDEMLTELFRVVHSLKGSGMYAGFSELAKVNHVFEDILDGIRSGEFSLKASMLELFFRVSDNNQNALEELKVDHNAEQDFSPLISELENLLEESKKESTSTAGRASDPATAESSIDSPTTPANSGNGADSEGLQLTAQQDRTYNILLVDDDPDIRGSLSAIISKNPNLQLQEAVDGSEAWKIYEANLTDKPFDMVISDLRMPNMNGVELIRKIRNHDKEIPIIISSGFGDREELLELLPLSVTSFLAKPFENTSVHEHLNRALRARILSDTMRDLTKINFKLYMATNKLVFSHISEHGSDPSSPKNQEILNIKGLLAECAEITSRGLRH